MATSRRLRSFAFSNLIQQPELPDLRVRCAAGRVPWPRDRQASPFARMIATRWVVPDATQLASVAPQIRDLSAGAIIGRVGPCPHRLTPCCAARGMTEEADQVRAGEGAPLRSFPIRATSPPILARIRAITTTA